MKKNVDLHTDQEIAKIRILRSLAAGGSSPASALGYVAFPGYSFKAPQGAAFAVARILSEMCSQRLLRRERRGYSIAQAGANLLSSHAPASDGAPPIQP